MLVQKRLKREEHLKAVYWFLSDVFKQVLPASGVKPALTEVFPTNAVRFLGLGRNQRTAERLIAFCKHHRVPNAARMVDEFQVI